MPTAMTDREKSVLRNCVAISVGRLETHPSGQGWQIRVPAKPGQSPDDVLIVGSNGEGLTRDEAEIALDRLDGFVASRN